MFEKCEAQKRPKFDELPTLIDKEWDNRRGIEAYKDVLKHKSSNINAYAYKWDNSVDIPAKQSLNIEEMSI